MNHTKLIHQFFDGEIEGTEEEALFSALAGDKELRREFVEHLKISSFIQHDTSRTGPPPEVSNAVFAAIGLPQPGAPFVEDDESAWQKFGVLIQRILPFAATIFITAAVTSGVLVLTDQSARVGDTAGPAITQTDGPAETSGAAERVAGENFGAAVPEGNAVQSTMSARHTTEAAVDHAAVDRAGESAASERDLTGVRALPPSRTVPASITGTSGSEPVVRNVVPGSPPQTALAAVLPRFTGEDVATAPVLLRAGGEMEHGQSETNAALIDMPFGQTPFTVANMIFQLRLVGVNSAFPGVDIAKPTEGVFRDMTITGLYKISERHAVGFTFGREAFGRTYTRTVLDKNVVFTETLQVSPDDYVQVVLSDYDMLDWGGITWKMSHPSLGIFHTFYPYTELTAAVSKYGPIGRAMLGIELYPSNASMINLGIELSSLGYKIEDKYYTSSKIGGSLGIALSL